MRIALTGGTTGIGAETARQLAAAGHAGSRFSISLNRRAALPNGSGWIWLTRPSSFAAAIAAAEKEFDGLCNIAGIPPRDDNAASCLAINTLGTIAFTRQFLARPANPPKAVITLASKAGFGWQDNLAQLEALPGLLRRGRWKTGRAEGLAPARAYQISKQAIIYWSQLQAAAHLGQTILALSASARPLWTPAFWMRFWRRLASRPAPIWNGWAARASQRKSPRWSASCFPRGQAG